MQAEATVKDTIQASLVDYVKAYSLMATARHMAELYEANKTVCAKYVHATSRGHEAIQIAAGLQLKPQDFAAPYYRDDAMLLAMGMSPYELMLQLMAKRDDPFSGGRSYYSHPSLRRDDLPKIPHQSSATGMQVIPATGVAQGLAYLESQGLLDRQLKAVSLCSLGDGAITEGEVAEAFQMAVLKHLPVIYLIQDNEWSISAYRSEFRNMNAYDYAGGFKGMERVQVDGTDYAECLKLMRNVFTYVREKRQPILVHAKCPLIGHHTSGVRREWYRPEENLSLHLSHDPVAKMRSWLQSNGVSLEQLEEIDELTRETVDNAYEQGLQAADPEPASALDHEFAPTPITEERGSRRPEGSEKVVMVDAALHAVDEILKAHPEALLYGQDVGGKLGGVFREAALLAVKYGAERVFNTPIQEAYIVGSTVGMSAAGAKPIVEIQFADYFWPAINQLAVEAAKSCYLSNGKWPVQTLIRVPIGAYGGGGPYHSGSIESALLTIRGVKICYPSNAADMKGLMKAAFYDPNPVIMLEHKGLYWSKVPGTEDAKTWEPAEDYVLPLGKAATVVEADAEKVDNGESAVVITYGMGVYWAKAAAKALDNAIEVVDLRTLNPLDFDYCVTAVRRHGKALVLTEEPLLNSFAESIAARLTSACFKQLDAPIATLGAKPVPAVPLNVGLEREVLPSAEKVEAALRELLAF